MHKAPVQSKSIKSIGYDAQTSTLEIEFHNGNVYQYFDVPQAVHVEMMQAASLGQFFIGQIKGNYRYAKL
jgi:hypothetical protein